MKYKIAQTKGYIAPSPKYLIHSAKGTTWEKHKYVKVEDGKYFYPSDSNNDSKSEPQGDTVESREPSGWDQKLISSFESSLSGNPDPKAVQQMLLFGTDDNGKSYDNFKMALNKAGIDTSEIDDASLNLMRYKVLEHYKKEFAKEKDSFDEKGNRIKDRENTKAVNKSTAKTKKKSAAKPKAVESKTDTTVKTNKTEGTETIKRKMVTNGTGTNYSPGQVNKSKKKN